jgi:uncharacterized protein (DUF2062 family)
MRSFLRRKIWEPLLTLLKQGLSPSQLAFSVALGAWIAVFPALGVTVLLCTAAAMVLRLNMIAIQTANFAAYPLQFVLLLPFFRAGAWLFNSPPLKMSAAEFVSLVAHDPLGAISRFWVITWEGAVAWALAGLLLVPLAWALLTPAFTRIARDLKGEAA